MTQEPTPASTSERARLTRRRFLDLCGGVGIGLVPGVSALTLAACGGGGSPDAAPASTVSSAPASSDPPSALTVLENPASASITIQARQVQWMAGKTPAEANAWVYVAEGKTAATGVLGNGLGPYINVRRNSPCAVTWKNAIGASPTEPIKLASPPINVPMDLGTCGRVRTQAPVGLATHLHGARVAAEADGWPLTPISFPGNPYGFAQTKVDTYPNTQRGTLLWYHDHAMDRVGRHVAAGLAGPYCIRDAADDAILALIGGRAHELLCVVQDKMLSADGTRIDYDAGIPHDPGTSNVGSDDAVGRPEFLGRSIFVNGHADAAFWLDRSAWRLRILNASNARTYALALCDPDAIAARSGRVWYTQCLRLIGGDGGLSGKSVPLADTDTLLVTAAQRRDVLVDLSSLPANVTRLRLVNLSLRYLLAVNAATLEAIYTSYEASVYAPASAQFTAADQTLYDALEGPLAAVARIALSPAAAVTPLPSPAAIDAVLADAAAEDDFVWNGSAMTALPGTTLGPNRLVLLMSNTERYEKLRGVNGIAGWGDVQVFEMQAGGTDWMLPFDVDLSTTAQPAAGGPVPADRGYRLARRSFFAEELNADVTLAKAYPALHVPTIRARAGTWERWYVGNLNNSQPISTASGAPDMHPFHIHLVNVIVTRRWQLDDSGAFVEVAASDLALDRIARQDTVAIASNEIVELLVHYPAGYTGDFAYHCHILEHEDMCMMLHYRVDA